ncbi:MAG TPA: pitrilysin family protein, partial [Phenylobacterium sp.]
MTVSMIVRRLGAWAAALALALSAIPAAAAPPLWTHEASDLKPNPDATYGRLPNGFRYVLLPNASPAKGASVRLRLDVGSMHEADNERGLAHFLEHLSFAGSKNLPRGELFPALERIGVRQGQGANAYTSPNETIFTFDLPIADGPSLDVVLKIIREYGSLNLDETSIDAERLVVLNEKRSRESPLNTLQEAQLDLWFHGRRAADRVPIGTDEVIANAPYARVRDFYRRYYRPERAMLVVVGDIDVAALEPKVRALFADWKGVGEPGVDPDLGKVGARGPQAKTFIEPGLPPKVSIVWSQPPDPEAQNSRSVRTLFMDLLGMGVLNRRLERMAAGASPPFTTATVSRQDVWRSARITSMEASAPTSGQGALEALILAQRQILTHGISQAELQVEIAELRTRLENRASNTKTEPSAYLADEILRTFEENGVYTNSRQDLALFNEGVKGITPEMVVAELKQAFSGEGPLVMVVSPAPIPGGEVTVLSVVRQAQGRAVSASVVQQTPWPYTSFGAPGKIAQRSNLADLDATLVTFANGVKLSVRPNRFR